MWKLTERTLTTHRYAPQGEFEGVETEIQDGEGAVVGRFFASAADLQADPDLDLKKLALEHYASTSARSSGSRTLPTG